VGVEGILGVRPLYEGLLVDPCIPSHWDGFRMRRTFRGASYEIEVENPEHVSSGVVEVIVDGQKQEGNVVPSFGDGKTHTVKVKLGTQK